ncbi:McrC family protein [Natranaerobius trueperi]|uniref:Restriction endonuclease n=1 Tax=Natranaerobius trueperi TaxID=759412 RepID=A0A226BZ78_9FIRM|nr:hypothetical protein [Natranaerobius trueperi]OWZ84092.1 hypothetical protein CDO51_05095 [Natranaerobius trueperi]
MTKSKDIYEVKEYQELMIYGYQLTSDEREYLQKQSVIYQSNETQKRFEFLELKGGVKIKGDSWVGVIELEKVRIIIKPKFNKGFVDLIDMICFSEEIPFYNWKDSRAEYDKFHDDFIEIYIKLLLFHIKKTMDKGIFKEYVTEEENLRRLRGRPDMIKNTKVNYAVPTRIYCCYDELLTDVPENQIILSALKAAKKMRMGNETKRRLNRFYHEFRELCSTFNGEYFPTFSYNRLNQHYETTHKLCYYILQQEFMKNLYKETSESFFCLLIDMNELFEQFVVKLLNKYLPKNFIVSAGKRIKGAIVSNSKSYRDIIPDISVYDKDNRNTLVLDAKYKHYGFKKIETSDIFQLTFYTHYFSNKKNSLDRSIIFFPRYSKEEEKEFTIQSLPETTKEVGLKAYAISIQDILHDAKENNRHNLKERACELIQ